MARSFPSRRFPAGPYIEPQVMPALRGPKRTGPIGEIVPGDDVEVARQLMRLGRRPLKEPVTYGIKLTGDLATDSQVLEPVDGFFVWPVEYDYDLLSLVYVSLHASTASAAGDTEVQIRKIRDEADEDLPADVDLFVVEFPLILPEGMRHTKNVEQSTDPDVSALTHEVDLENSQVQLGDALAVDFDAVGDAIGLTLHLWFR